MTEYISVYEDDTKDVTAAGADDSDWGPENKSFKRPRKGRSEVWKYFDLSKNQELAKCRMCGKVYKTSRNTSNLFDHLKRCGKQKRPRLGTKVRKCTKTRKTELDRALTRMIALDVQSFRIVEDEGFRNFVNCLDPRYQLPTRQELQNVHLKSMFDEMSKKLVTTLNDIKYCAATASYWTSRENVAYLTVTCHFVTTDFKLQSVVLSTTKLAQATHVTAENVANKLRNALSNWNVHNKVVAVVTDNTPTMIDACNLIKLPNLPCFSYTLHLLVQDVLALKSLKFLVAKCKRIVAYFKDSVIAYEKLRADYGQSKHCSLTQEQPDRWNSAYNMCNSILLMKESITTVLQTTQNAPQSLTEKELEQLDDLCNLLSLLNDASLEISTENCVTISLIIPIASGLYTGMNNLKNDMRTAKGHDICNFLIECLRERIFTYESATATRISTLLDPRFKKSGFHLHQNAVLAVKTLEKEMVDIEKCRSKIVPDPLSLSEYNTLDAGITLRDYTKKATKPKDFDPLEFWKTAGGDEITALKLIAKRYLCIPGTTTESKRMFSKAGEIFSDRRASVKPNYLHMMLFVRTNQWLLNL